MSQPYEIPKTDTISQWRSGEDLFPFTTLRNQMKGEGFSEDVIRGVVNSNSGDIEGARKVYDLLRETREMVGAINQPELKERSGNLLDTESVIAHVAVTETLARPPRQDVTPHDYILTPPPESTPLPPNVTPEELREIIAQHNSK